MRDRDHSPVDHDTTRENTMQTMLKLHLIAVAFAASGAVHAEGAYLLAGSQPVRSALGECWRTGAWAPQAAMIECDPQLAAAPATTRVAEAPARGDTLQAPHFEKASLEARKPIPQRTTYPTEVLFDFDGTELRADGRKVLDDLAQKLLATELESVAAIAHADRVGDEAYNERLALRRADAIRTYLVGKGVPEKLVRVDSKGEREPVTAGRCDALGEESRRNSNLIACLQPDRRVEIEVAGREGSR
jgi:OOP family OmpA-OmpF porin